MLYEVITLGADPGNDLPARIEQSLGPFRACVLLYQSHTADKRYPRCRSKRIQRHPERVRARNNFV